MKTMMTLAALLLGSTAALAGEPINDPRAEVFRAAGCDAEWLRPITDASGNILYWNNTDGKGCPTQSGGMDPDHNAFKKAESEDDHEVEPEEELASK